MCHGTMQLLLLLHMLLRLHMLQLQLATYAAVVVMWQAPSVANNEREWERASWKMCVAKKNVRLNCS